MKQKINSEEKKILIPDHKDVYGLTVLWRTEMNPRQLEEMATRAKPYERHFGYGVERPTPGNNRESCR